MAAAALVCSVECVHLFVCVCCLLAGQIGQVFMALGPPVSFVVALVVFPIRIRSVQYLATSCHTNKSRKSVSLASFIHLLYLFSLSVNRMFLTVSLTHPPYPFFLSPGSAFLPLIVWAILLFHCLLGSAFLFCLFAFIIYPDGSSKHSKMVLR